MSHFEGLSTDVLGIVLVGAEGCAETNGESWIRDATEEEQQLFKDHCRSLFTEANGGDKSKRFDFSKFLVDGNGRPFWIKAVLDQPNTPTAARFKAQRFTRVFRIASD